MAEAIDHVLGVSFHDLPAILRDRDVERLRLGYLVPRDNPGAGAAERVEAFGWSVSTPSTPSARSESSGRPSWGMSQVVGSPKNWVSPSRAAAEPRLRQSDRSVDAWVASLLPDEPMVAIRDRLVPMEPVPVVGPLVELRPPGPELTDWVEAAYRDPKIRQWNPGNVTDRTTAADWIRHRTDWASGDHASWIFCEPHGGKPVGSVSLHKVNQNNLSASIGYWTHPDERGRGLASAAVQLASTWALDQLRLKRLEIIHAVVNPASCKVAERAGFELEGTVRLGERYGDKQWYDEHIHGRVNP